MESKKDCFGYVSEKECSALIKVYCKKEVCKFYKTTDELWKGDKANEYINKTTKSR